MALKDLESQPPDVPLGMAKIPNVPFVNVKGALNAPLWNSKGAELYQRHSVHYSHIGQKNDSTKLEGD